MAITGFERNEIKKEAEFLERLGYARSEDLYSINYNLHDICISVIYPPNSEESDVTIQFIEKNQVFSVGWIALVRSDIRGSDDKFMNVKELLKYVENQYPQIKDYQYCVESNRLVDIYVEKHRDKFDSVVRDFLSQN